MQTNTEAASPHSQDEHVCATSPVAKEFYEARSSFLCIVLFPATFLALQAQKRCIPSSPGPGGAHIPKPATPHHQSMSVLLGQDLHCPVLRGLYYTSMICASVCARACVCARVLAKVNASLTCARQDHACIMYLYIRVFFPRIQRCIKLDEHRFSAACRLKPLFRVR